MQNLTGAQGNTQTQGPNLRRKEFAANQHEVGANQHAKTNLHPARNLAQQQAAMSPTISPNNASHTSESASSMPNINSPESPSSKDFGKVWGLCQDLIRKAATGDAAAIQSLIQYGILPGTMPGSGAELLHGAAAAAVAIGTGVHGSVPVQSGTLPVQSGTPAGTSQNNCSRANSSRATCPATGQDFPMASTGQGDIDSCRSPNCEIGADGRNFEFRNSGAMSVTTTRETFGSGGRDVFDQCDQYRDSTERDSWSKFGSVKSQSDRNTFDESGRNTYDESGRNTYEDSQRHDTFDNGQRHDTFDDSQRHDTFDDGQLGHINTFNNRDSYESWQNQCDAHANRLQMLKRRASQRDNDIPKDSWAWGERDPQKDSSWGEFWNGSESSEMVSERPSSRPSDPSRRNLDFRRQDDWRNDFRRQDDPSSPSGSRRPSDAASSRGSHEFQEFQTRSSGTSGKPPLLKKNNNQNSNSHPPGQFYEGSCNSYDGSMHWKTQKDDGANLQWKTQPKDSPGQSEASKTSKDSSQPKPGTFIFGYPSGGYDPSGDYPSGGYPSGGYPSGGDYPGDTNGNAHNTQKESHDAYNTQQESDDTHHNDAHDTLRRSLDKQKEIESQVRIAEGELLKMQRDLESLERLLANQEKYIQGKRYRERNRIRLEQESEFFPESESGRRPHKSHKKANVDTVTGKEYDAVTGKEYDPVPAGPPGGI